MPAQALAKIWDLRNGGQVEAARQSFASLQADWGVFPEQGDWKASAGKLANKLSPEEIIEFLLLPVSFRRNDRDLKAADANLQEIFAFAQEERIALPAAYFLQAGLNSLARSDWTRALELFLQGKRLVNTTREECLLHCNALLCMEELGLDFFGQLPALREKLAAAGEKSWVTSIHQQLRALALRQAFRSGDLSSMKAELDAPTKGEQDSYFAAYLAELPYLEIKAASEAAADFSHYLDRQGFTYLAAFRLHTLRCLHTDADDHEAVKPGERAERLYLWTWKFLAEPSAAAALRLQSEWEIFFRRAGTASLSAEQYKQLELSLLWLLLFQGGQTEMAAAALANVRHSTAPIRLPMLEAEQRLLQYFFALRACSTFAADEKMALELDLRAPGPKALLKFAQERLLPLLEKPAASALLVIPAHQKIITGTSETVSESLTKLFLAFRSSAARTKADIALEVFGIRRFDPVLHEPKLANLLSRANKFPFGKDGFRARSGHVHAPADFARLVRFHFASPWTDACRLLSLNFLVSGAENPPQTRDLTFLTEDYQPRREFESLIGSSRATAARMLQRWKTKGLVSVSGSGRAVRYKAAPALIPILQKNISERTTI